MANMEKMDENNKKAAYVPSTKELSKMAGQEQETYKEIEQKIKRGLYEPKDMIDRKGTVIAQKIINKETGRVVFYNSLQQPADISKVPEPRLRSPKSDYHPSSGENMLEEIIQTPAAIRDILGKIKMGIYLWCPENEWEEKVTDAAGNIIFYNDVKETGNAVLAPHIKKAGA